MKNTRWMILAAVVVALALGAAWIGLKGTSPVPDQGQPDTTAPPARTQNSNNTPTGTEAQPQPSQQESGPAPDANVANGVEVLYGELVSEVNAVEFQLYCVKNTGCEVPETFVLLGLSPSDIDLSNVGQRLDYWLLNHFSEASVSIVETWFAENRVAVNDQLVEQTYKLKQDDLIALQVTEFSALRIAIADYLKNPDRTEYDLLEISMAPIPKLKQSGIFAKRYLAVGKLFNQDIRNVNLETLGELKGSLSPWKDWEFIGTFGPYRVFELS